MVRIEKDTLGKVEIPENALYGIHSYRASLNFPTVYPFPAEWYKAMGKVKAAVYNTYRRFRKAAEEKYGSVKTGNAIDDKVLDAMIRAAGEVGLGLYREDFIVPGIQGGAGTSINMNVNEIIANAALTTIGLKPGMYDTIDPVEECNIFQSTNDAVPTALSIAVMDLLNLLAGEINTLRQAMEELEKGNRNELRQGYTQMQEALPSSFGILFGSWNEALSRDWWRVSKSLERIRVVNMGGGATGTGMALPRFYIMEIVPELRNSTGLPLSRSENMSDATSNLDKWVEVHATIKAHAVNLEKIASDLRLLSSDIMNTRQLTLPEKQVGSSIMPGKINPVIPEFVISAAHRIYANDQVITSLSGQGCLELNAYLPTIGVSIIESLKLLIDANRTLLDNCIRGLSINRQEAYEKVLHSPSVTTALIPYLGYNRASEIASRMKSGGITIYEANKIMNFMEPSQLEEILKPANLLKMGYSLDEI
ncbi:MAG: aspartate ammonia-lyase [Bacteroidales bacterium]|nr:aspartate ammonia-lyase [Bacteroidales bacterium]